jgi:hypothetical protein
MKQRGGGPKSRLVPILVGALVIGMLVAAGPVSAVDTIHADDICMQRAFVGPGNPVLNKNRLNCTANDVSIATALEDTISPTSCDPNDPPFTLEVDFVVDVTAANRYDVGFFFRTDGGASARGDAGASEPAGSCATIALDPASPNVLQLDNDSCGDLTQGEVTLRFEIPHVACVVAPGTNPPQVKLPYCTAWHNLQTAVCSISAHGGFDLKPDERSKCLCNDGFFVPVVVEQPSGTVAKTATKALVTYQVDVTNGSSVAVDLKALADDKYGNLFLDKNSLPTANTAIARTDCAAKTNIAAGATTTCTFDVLYSNNGGTAVSKTNTVTATLHRTDGQGDDQNFTGNTTININLGLDNRP